MPSTPHAIIGASTPNATHDVRLKSSAHACALTSRRRPSADARSCLSAAALIAAVRSCARRRAPTAPVRPTPLPSSPGSRSSAGSCGSRISGSCAIPNPPPPVVLRPATATQPAIVAPPPPSDLIRLLGDAEARVRRRAALAVGRVGLPRGVEPLARLLADDELEVRQMAAFALGLIGDAAARPALLKALDGCRADRAGARGRGARARSATAPTPRPSARWCRRTSRPARSRASSPTISTYPLAPPVEAVAARAVRAGAAGRPTTRWRRRCSTPTGSRCRAGGRWPTRCSGSATRGRRRRCWRCSTPGPLHRLVRRPRARRRPRRTQAAAALRQIVEQRRRDPAVVIQAIRALAALGDRRGAAADHAGRRSGDRPRCGSRR